MGMFVQPEEMKSKALVPLLKSIGMSELDELFIYPAERMIEEAFRLELDTDGDPLHFTAKMDSASYPTLRTDFQTDFKRAVYLLVNRMAINWQGFGSQGVRSSSVTFGKKIPEEVRSLMLKWGQPRRLYRA